MAELAPIVLFVYNRPWHTKQTLEALSKNFLSDKSQLYIYADGPKENATEPQLKKIEETRLVLKEKKWCSEVKIIERDKNIGLSNSIIIGVTEIVSKYGKIIVLEDDIVCSPFFLKFMNETLKSYSNSKKVFGGTAYVEDIDHLGNETYFHRKGSCWGWCTWNRVWENFIPDASLLIKQFTGKEQIRQFNLGGYPFYEMLKDHLEKKIDSWDICFYAYSFLNKGLWLTSGKNLVKNIGFDSSGTHCKDNDSFKSEIYYGEVIISDSLKVEEDAVFNKKRERFYRQLIKPSLSFKIINRLKKFFL
jgi:GR25 family glycosyltransferase involved in LPS biosynthesis